jgi:hypothetical protein
MTTASRFGHDPVRDLTLQHHDEARKEVVAREKSAQNGRSHRVRQICRHLPRRLAFQSIEILPECINMPDLEVIRAESLLKGLRQVFIEFECEHPLEFFEQGFGQGAAPGPYLEDPRRVLGQQGYDALGDINVDEEILPEPVTLRPTHERFPEF